MPIRSPGAKRSPPRTARPTIWWPTTSGSFGPGSFAARQGSARSCAETHGNSPSTTCRSVRQTPHAETSTSTCPWPGSGSGRSAARSGFRGSSSTIARMCGDNRLMPMDVAEVAAHARTENFPIASLLFPREYRPHMRAIYGFARLVDLLGDDWEGDRLAALDELERQLDLCYEGEPEWPVMRELQPTIRACSLPREPFWRLIECNRQDQRVSDYETWADLKAYCTLSADPVGRLVLGVVGQAGDDGLVAWSDDVCTGLQLVNFLP